MSWTTGPQFPITNRSRFLSKIVAATFEGGDDEGHPCEECTICLTPIPNGTRYTTWEFRLQDGNNLNSRIGLEHICMECDWQVRQLISKRTIPHPDSV